MRQKTPLNVSIASPPDREFHVAEIFEKSEEGLAHIAEINQESDELMVEIYPRADGKPIKIGYEVFVEALQRGKERLESFDPRESAFFKGMKFDE